MADKRICGEVNGKKKWVHLVTNRKMKKPAGELVSTRAGPRSVTSPLKWQGHARRVEGIEFWPEKLLGSGEFSDWKALELSWGTSQHSKSQTVASLFEDYPDFLTPCFKCHIPWSSGRLLVWLSVYAGPTGNWPTSLLRPPTDRYTVASWS